MENKDKSAKKEKPKKEKITYIDDGRTIADMSALPHQPKFTKRGTSSGFREIWRTYWMATRMMLVPTLIAAGFIVVAYLIVLVLFHFF